MAVPKNCHQELVTGGGRLFFTIPKRAMELEVTLACIQIVAMLATLNMLIIPVNGADVKEDAEGFVSIDCGGMGGPDNVTGLNWISHIKHLQAADQLAKERITIIANVKLDEKLVIDNAKRLETALLFFPGNRGVPRVARSKFCFNMSVDFVETEDAKNYLLRGTFPSRNLTARDDNGENISFEPYSTRFYFTVDSTYVATVDLQDGHPQILELIVTPFATNVYVCLVPLEDRSSMPAISALEWRPLRSGMYTREVHETSAFFSSTSRGIPVQTSYLMTISRLNFGGDTSNKSSLRFPSDMFDRLWISPAIPHSQSSAIKSITGHAESNSSKVPSMYGGPMPRQTSEDYRSPPLDVLSTAWVGRSLEDNISFTWNLNDKSRPQRAISTFYFTLDFYDITTDESDMDSDYDGNDILGILTAPAPAPGENDSARARTVDILYDEGNGIKEFVTNFSINRSWTQFYNKRWLFANDTIHVTITSQSASSEPPLINAAEIFGEFNAVNGRTVKNDATAVEKLAQEFPDLLDGAGAGDPCLPIPWAWIVCSIELPPRVTEINLTHASVGGNLSGVLDGLESLTVLDLSFNNFDGAVPESLGKISTLRALNKLSGELPKLAPQSLGNLETLSLSSNNFSGDLSALVSACDVTISKLNVSNNSFNGSIPLEVENLKSLQTLDLSFNNLFGELKFDLRRLKSLHTLNLRNNRLTGVVPDSIFNISSLKDVDLDGNQFTELNLTSWYESLKEAKTFDALRQDLRVRLRGNSILTIIPTSLEYLEITTPPTEAERQRISLYVQNSFILLADNTWCRERPSSRQVIVRYLCRKNEQDPFWLSDNNGISTQTNVWVLMPSTLLIIIILSVTAYILWKMRRKMLRHTHGIQQIYEVLAKEHVKPPIFSYVDLKAATQDFSTNNILGKGGFGTVYKAELADGRVLAVKKLIPTKQNTSDFLKEIVNLTGIKHKNLIQLMGCCVREEQQHMLVYEYADNKSLAEALWPKGVDEGFIFDWQRRFNICLGIAQGLAYFHEELQPKMVHRDIKPQNILLDTEYNAKIADFGLTRSYKTDDTVTSLIGGTRGYLAPEYMNHIVSEKLDVYSYGVVALEIVSGRSCIDKKLPEDKIYLPNWAMTLYEGGQLLNLVDERLMGKYKEDEVLMVLQTALTCCHLSPKDRPTMSQVVSKLMKHADIAMDIVKELGEERMSLEGVSDDDLSVFMSTSAKDTVRSETIELSLSYNS